MKKEEIIEGNKLIAEFMGLKNLHAADWYSDGNNVGFYVDDEVCYHSSWDWLMPAWYKFRDLPLKGNIRLAAQHDDFCGNIVRGISYGTIKDAFHELSSAIKWYNSTK